MKSFNEVVSEVFSVNQVDIKDEMTSQDIPGWDSMNYLMLISSLESEFGITFTMDQIVNATTLGDLRKIVEHKDNNAS